MKGNLEECRQQHDQWVLIHPPFVVIEDRDLVTGKDWVDHRLVAIQVARQDQKSR